MRIRTIDDGYEELKIDDPGTSITKTALRRAITTGEIPSRRIGARGGYKYTFDLDLAEAYFAGKEVR